jgi:hypothetical protein
VSDLPALPQPYPYLRVGHLDAAPLPEGIGTAIDLSDADPKQTLAQGLDCVVVSAAGSEHRIAPHVLEVLTACEEAGVPTVLRAREREDLRSPIAAVVSHIALETEDLYREGLRQVGPERAFEIRPVVDPVEVLTAVPDDVGTVTAEAARVRRRLLAEQTARAQADRFADLLGLPVEPEPLVTALIVSRHAKNLHYTLQNLRRQTYGRIDPLLVIDPLYEKQAREVTTNWDIPLRIVVSNSLSTLGDRLNLGVEYAYGDLVTVIEESALYGSHHVTDLVQAAQYSGARLVGKASWFFQNDDGRAQIRAPKSQRSFGDVPALGTVMLSRENARRIGFIRRARGINVALTYSVLERGATIFSVHAHDTVMLRGRQSLEDLRIEELLSAAASDPAQ